MSRSERWNTKNEIKRRFRKTTDPENGAGPIILAENGEPYSVDSESHIEVIGKTGKGKSQCCSLPFIREILKKGESAVVLDPKKECYMQNADRIPDGYQTFCVDFRNPRKSPTKWNPLSTPYRLSQSERREDRDIASSMVSELWNGVCPYDGHSDKFWSDSSANYAKGLTYGLFETADEEQVNLDSVAVMMEQSEIRYASGTIAKTFYETLPDDSLAKRNLATYVTAPNETRASIHSVAASNIEVFSRSKGLMEMLSQDTLNILDLDVTRPFIIFIVLPDETDVYDTLAGLLVSQISQHLIRVAQDLGGRLPIRVNLVLEELGSVGKSIPNLPNLMVAGRSRNLRLMLILQSNAQLVDVYGKSKAETIHSCIGMTIAFSTNSWETLKEWSQRCGERQVEINNHIVKEPLITAAQLAAMPAGTALILIDNQYKFISRLPFFYETYGYSEPKELPFADTSNDDTIQTLNFEELVKGRKKKQVRAALAERKRERRQPIPFWAMAEDEEPMNMEDLLAQIDKKIAALDAEGLE